jgi:hypothetical protein
VLDRRPPTHLEADCADQHQGGRVITPLESGQVDPSHPMQGPPPFTPWLVTLPLWQPWPRCGLRLLLTRLGNGAPGRFELAVACSALLVIDVGPRDRLGQGAQRLRAPLTVQRRGAGRFVVLTAIMAELRQLHRIALPAQDGTDHSPPGPAWDVADHLLPLEMHRGQRFLPVLEVLAGLGQQHAPRPSVTA